MFYKDSENVYRVRPLDIFDWLVHGFGTRLSKDFGKCRNVGRLNASELYESARETRRHSGCSLEREWCCGSRKKNEERSFS